MLAALVYCWDLTNSGYANDFYAAAVKSGTKSWEAWFFGSLDSSNAITVDKPPAALWLMGLSARVFGFSSFSLLLPQALMGVGAVALTHATVRRASGPGAGFVAGLVVTLTPVAALMFRFDNPDALLVLLMTAAAYCVSRVLGEPSRTITARTAFAWMIGAGLLIGFAFLTKMLQGLLVLPGMGLAYLVAARYSLRTRILHLLGATLGVVVGAGWLIAVEALWPAASRPYIGGSTDNSLWQLAIGYNGLGRIMGGSGNAGGGGGMGGGGFGGTAGLFRMFNSQFGTEISWLLPASLLLLVAGIIARGKASRTDHIRAALVMWGGWLTVTLLCLSFMEGTVHSYYSVALVPAIGACIGVGGHEVWTRRRSLTWRLVLAVTLCASAAWTFRLLATSSPTWWPWLRWAVLALTIGGSLLFVAAPHRTSARMRRIAGTGLLVAVLGVLAAPAAWTSSTISQGHTGSMPTSGPLAGEHGGQNGGGMMARDGATRNRSASGSDGNRPQGSTPGGQGGSPGAQAPSGAKPAGGAQPQGGTPPNGGPGQGSQLPGGATTSKQAAEGAGPKNVGTGSKPSSSTTPTADGGTAQSGQPGGGGGSSTNTALTSLLDATTSKWSAAVIGDQSEAGYILHSNTAVMAIGGWSGTDNNVSLGQFQKDVNSGDVRYFIAGGGMGGGPGGNSGAGAQITAWVKAHFASKTVGGVTVYDLTHRTA